MSGVRFHTWPNRVPNPFAARGANPLAIVIRIPDTTRGPVGKAKTRTVLSALINHWSGIDIALEETPTGPILTFPFPGQSASLSISYGEESAWLALCIGSRVGIDVVSVTAFPEMYAVASLYLGERVTAQIRSSAEPERAFAHQWARYEAALKCHFLAINEAIEIPESQFVLTETPETVIALAFPENTNPIFL